MSTTANCALSLEMRRAYNHAKAHGDVLLREPGGFWRVPGVRDPSFSTSTIWALIKRNAAEYSDWKDGRNGRFPIAIIIKALP